MRRKEGEEGAGLLLVLGNASCVMFRAPRGVIYVLNKALAVAGLFCSGRNIQRNEVAVRMNGYLVSNEKRLVKEYYQGNDATGESDLLEETEEQRAFAYMRNLQDAYLR